MTAPLDVEELLAKAHRPSEEAMRLHPLYRGKPEVTPKCPIGDLSDFAVWYTPGVAAPCRDAIADNTSAARVAIRTDGVAPRDVDLREIECTFTVDGEVTGRATGEALLGSPAECVALLVRHLARSGRGLDAGWLVMAGAPLDARPFGRGTIATASYSHLGDVTVRGV